MSNELVTLIREAKAAAECIRSIHHPLNEYCNECGGMFPCHTRVDVDKVINIMSDMYNMPLVHETDKTS